jgi:hypothetical protein
VKAALGGDLGQDALFRLLSSDYLETMGAHLVAGRLLDEHDRAEPLATLTFDDGARDRHARSASGCAVGAALVIP